jgi:hypothetical protein
MSYYSAVKKMEEMNVENDYILGWVSGFLNNPVIEEQRRTTIYTSGYDDGKDNLEDSFHSYIIK